MPIIKACLGTCLLREGDFREDARENTDLRVLFLESVRIGVRIRRYPFYEKYPDDFTIRYSVPSGAKTEIHKIMDGWGDLFFYCFSNEQENRLIKWTLADLNVFREWYTDGMGIVKPVPVSGCFMEAFGWSQFPDNLIVDSSEKRLRMTA